MASGLSLVRSAGREIAHVAVGSVSEVIGGGTIGFVHAKYKDRWFGEYMPEMAAGVGKVALAIARGFGGAHSWAADIVGGVVASPGMVLTSAKYGIKLAEYLEEKKAKAPKKLLGAANRNPALGYVPPVDYSAMTISEAERQRFAAGR